MCSKLVRLAHKSLLSLQYAPRCIGLYDCNIILNSAGISSCNKVQIVFYSEMISCTPEASSSATESAKHLRLPGKLIKNRACIPIL